MTSMTIKKQWEERAKKEAVGEITNISPNLFTMKAVSENYQDYKNPTFMIITSVCDFKCCREANVDESMCQNSPLMTQIPRDIPTDNIIYLYKRSMPICQGILFGGLEPMMQLNQLYHFCKQFRDSGIEDDIVIYTGYYPEELNPHDMLLLISLKNVIIKFGRYIPNSTPRYDEVLGITLSSDNQYAVKF